MPTHYPASAELLAQHTDAQQNVAPTPTYGLLAPHGHVGDEAPSNFSGGPLNAADPLPAMFSDLTLGDSMPQVPAQPPQDIAVEPAQHADTKDNFPYAMLSPIRERALTPANRAATGLNPTTALRLPPLPPPRSNPRRDVVRAGGRVPGVGIGARSLLGLFWGADLDRDLPGNPLLIAWGPVKEKKEKTEKNIIYPHSRFTDRFSLCTPARPGPRERNVEPPRESRPATDPARPLSTASTRGSTPSLALPVDPASSETHRTAATSPLSTRSLWCKSRQDPCQTPPCALARPYLRAYARTNLRVSPFSRP
ncbi:hypothetical protein FRC08_012314 [Ceratobasidium sp. 394]|nr:hypothetical protein FRC08_012314 [Ceratobasidium sp. 394]